MIETLRHTGIRIEELLELTQLAIVSHRLADTGELVPLLQIVPSKTNEERLLLVAPELASVLASIITRIRNVDGTVPLVARYDGHEHVTGPELPHLFQHRDGFQHQNGWRIDVLHDKLVRDLLTRALLAPASPTPPASRCATPRTTSGACSRPRRSPAGCLSTSQRKSSTTPTCAHEHACYE